MLKLFFLVSCVSLCLTLGAQMQTVFAAGGQLYNRGTCDITQFPSASLSLT